MSFPFKQKRLAQGVLIREFSKDVNESELVWHQDKLKREIKVISGSGWTLQFENKLPVRLVPGKSYVVEARQWHRVLKGETPLKIAIFEKRCDPSTILFEQISNHVIEQRDAGVPVEKIDAQVFSMLEKIERGQMLTEGVGESLMSLFGSASNGGFLQGLQKKIGVAVAGMMGVPQNSFIYAVVVNTIENMDLATLKSMMGIGRRDCRPLAEKFSGVIAESVVELVRQHSGMTTDSALLNIIIEGLQKNFVEHNALVDSMSDFICGLNISTIFGGHAGSQPTAQPAAASPISEIRKRLKVTRSTT